MQEFTTKCSALRGKCEDGDLARIPQVVRIFKNSLIQMCNLVSPGNIDFTVLTSAVHITSIHLYSDIVVDSSVGCYGNGNFQFVFPPIDGADARVVYNS